MTTAKEQYCPVCNELVPQTEDGICPSCGHVMKKKPFSSPENIPQDQDAIPLESFTLIWGIVGFLFPYFGILAYLLFQESRPISADNAKQGAILGLIIQVPFIILLIIIMMVA